MKRTWDHTDVYDKLHHGKFNITLNIINILTPMHARETIC